MISSDSKAFIWGRPWAVWICLCVLSLLNPPAITEAFSTSGRNAPTACARSCRILGPLAAIPQDKRKRTKASPIYAQDTSVAEVPLENLSTPGVLQPELELASTVQPQDFFSSFQLRSLDRDTLINISIIVVAIVLVATQVLSINTGITRGWTAEEVAYRVPIDNWRSYNDILNMAPIQTKAITSATVYTIGDIIAQRTEGVEVGELDRGRIGRSLAAGLIGHGPLSHVWYQVSEDFFETVLHWTEWWSFVPKVVLDQTFWGPFWNNTYIVLLGLMQFQKPTQIWSDIKRTTIPLVISGLKLWPLAHCVTYGLVPVENRLLWVDLVEIIWVTILATQASGAVTTDEEPPIQDESVGASRH
eukprot:CAMPEP_0172551944 /NCGR_PEP_ID=MMETSP1067-20121228/42535_1 /TAXON_ID=265564 ORGANISM="Thalassiosira punctigera, Strain Tpunct2005C2" /NCGR_SAMPLE_ID=MMETSP1067 /ASSEMBLY_ACC=CAM_ASM_000444 /LENGTH=359 /DNA_ID=CAMNT_0013339827 /DNA_START=173 /DNA_END=1252 /DNA_ORIENTATION=-